MAGVPLEPDFGFAGALIRKGEREALRRGGPKRQQQLEADLRSMWANDQTGTIQVKTSGRIFSCLTRFRVNSQCARADKTLTVISIFPIPANSRHTYFDLTQSLRHWVANPVDQ